MLDGLLHPHSSIPNVQMGRSIAVYTVSLLSRDSCERAFISQLIYQTNMNPKSYLSLKSACSYVNASHEIFRTSEVLRIVFFPLRCDAQCMVPDISKSHVTQISTRFRRSKKRILVSFGEWLSGIFPVITVQLLFWLQRSML